HTQERRLAAAARTEQGGQRSRGDLHRDPVERHERAEPLRHVADDDRHQAFACRGRTNDIVTRTATAMSASTSEIAYAPGRSRFRYASCTARVAVCVRPSMFPDTIATAPYSPRQRAVVKTTP